MSDKMREEFESALLSEKCASGDELVKADWIARGSDGEYRSYFVRGAWWAWTASREALVVELPRIGICAMTNDLIGYQRSLSDCRKAIHATGVTTK